MRIQLSLSKHALLNNKTNAAGLEQSHLEGTNVDLQLSFHQIATINFPYTYVIWWFSYISSLFSSLDFEPFESLWFLIIFYT